MTQHHDDSAETYDALAHCLETFIARWERKDAPSIADCLPAEPPALRRMALVELIKVDLEYRSQRGALRKLEDYVAEHPELDTGGGPPTDLIYEEYHVRKSSGDVPTTHEYVQRFPEQAEGLRELLSLNVGTLSSSFVPTPPRAELASGEQIDDFDLIAQLGKGAFATVFLARQKSMERLVALKVSADQGQEPQLLAQLDHPHIVRVYDQRCLPERQLRLLYMQYAPGGTLHEVVVRVRAAAPDQRNGALLHAAIAAALERGPLGSADSFASPASPDDANWPEAVCQIGSQLAAGLGYAHRQGVLHRDIKPANILLTASGAPQLADFNVSFSSEIENSVPAAYFGGSLAYMSPEQLEAFHPKHQRTAADVDRRSDIYSLAVVLWELLFGKRPFQDPSPAGDWAATLDGLIERRRTAQPKSPTDQPPGEALAPLVQTLRRCLAPNPDHRPQTAEELGAELSLCLQPHALELLEAPRGMWGFARRAPLTAFMLAIVTPNALAGVFNYLYNSTHIEALLEIGSARHSFEYVQATINGVAFPLGMAVCAAIAWPVARVIRLLNSGLPVDPPLLDRARGRALHLGRVAVVVGVIEWVVAGVTYPVSLHLLTGVSEPRVLADMYLQFLLSLTLCGLMAAAYPFFGVTLLAGRVFYPALLAVQSPDARLAGQLKVVKHRCGVYLPIAVAVPLVSAAAYVFSGGMSRPVLLLLTFAGLAALGFTAAAYSAIQKDIAALDAIRVLHKDLPHVDDEGRTAEA